MSLLHPKSEIQFTDGPGPTINNAISSQDRIYLSPVSQLLSIWH